MQGLKAYSGLKYDGMQYTNDQKSVAASRTASRIPGAGKSEVTPTAMSDPPAWNLSQSRSRIDADDGALPSTSPRWRYPYSHSIVAGGFEEMS